MYYYEGFCLIQFNIFLLSTPHAEKRRKTAHAEKKYFKEKLRKDFYRLIWRLPIISLAVRRSFVGFAPNIVKIEQTFARLLNASVAYRSFRFQRRITWQ